MNKNTYDRIMNTVIMVVVICAILTDRYPAHKIALLMVMLTATFTCVFVHFKHRFACIDAQKYKK